jgi:ABC-type glutathione transport system ATPase component
VIVSDSLAGQAAKRSMVTGIGEVITSSWEDLANKFLALEDLSAVQICAECWDSAPYFPVPSIFEAAIALRSGLSIREIAHSEASEHEIEKVQQTIQAIVDASPDNHQHAICFLTGVPGSGKTLVGLSLAHSTQNRSDAIHFMSGNGPLVKVLQHLFTEESKRAGAKAV